MGKGLPLENVKVIDLSTFAAASSRTIETESEQNLSNKGTIY